MFKIENTIREIKGAKKEVTVLAGVGNLTKDVEVREIETKNGLTSVAGGFGQSIAFNYWEDGERKTQFFPIEAWNFTAENLGKWGKKGVEMFVVGRLEKRSYTNKQGEMYVNQTLVVEMFQITSKGFERIDSKTQTPVNTNTNTQASNEDLVDELEDEWIPF